jgi:hypothetical protein
MRGRKKGFKHSEESKRRMSIAQKGKPRPYQSGSKHGMWKGNNITYQGIHSWFRDKKKDKCDFCGSVLRLELALKKGKKHERNMSNYFTLCVPCHRKYDARPAWNKGLKTYKKCEFCGGNFHLKRKTNRFCSNKCSAQGRPRFIPKRDSKTGQWLELNSNNKK